MDEPIAFLSYAHADDADGRVTKLREAIGIECRMHIGRPFTIFQDRDDIKWGQAWRSRVRNSLAAATFFIPILSPSFLRSKECCKELELFVERERELGRSDLILPILYIPIPELDKGSDDGVLGFVIQRQYADWRQLRLEKSDSPRVRRQLARLAERVRTVLDEVEKPGIAGRQEATSKRRPSKARRKVATQPRNRATTGSARPTKTRWEGIWNGATGYVFGFVMHLTLRPSGKIDGYILWRLRETPPQSEISNRVNDSGNEKVRGRMKRDGSGIELEGYEVDDPSLLATDKYDITFVDPPAHPIRRFSGKSRDNDNSWDARLKGMMTRVSS